jgi:Holliday junction resolvasome RuvABC endonuclease subunit
MHSTTQSTILGIDPGTKEMGLAVLRGRELLAYGVRTLRNGEHPYDVIGQARRIVLAEIERHSPQIVAIEKPLMLPTKRAALLSVIAQELHERAKELSLEVREISPQEVRQAVVGNPQATKIDVAEALVQGGFDQLHGLIPKRPVRAALGLRPRDKYWLHMFDALALAAAIAADVRSAAPRAIAADPGIFDGSVFNRDS